MLFLDKEISPREYKLVASNFINSLNELKDSIDIKASTSPSHLMILPTRTSINYQSWFKVSLEGECIRSELFMYPNSNYHNANDIDPVDHLITIVNNQPLDLTPQEIEVYLNNYSVTNCDYQQWLEVGMALHHQFLGNDIGKMLWDNWSIKDKRYKDGEINNKWNSFKIYNPNPITFATIIKKVNSSKSAISSKLYMPKVNNIQWHDLSGGKNPVPKCTLENFKILLDTYNIQIKFNEITHTRDIFFNNPLFANDNYEINQESNNITRIKSLCERHSIKQQSIYDYINVVANENAYNPFKEIIENTKWDGISRLDDFYNTIIVEPENEEIKKLYLRKWLLQAVYLTCLNDGEIVLTGRQVLVFQGNQHIGKTTWFKTLLPSNLHHFLIDGVKLDTNNDMSIKNCIEKIFVELGELGSTFRKSDQDSLKAFISKHEDSLNMKYMAQHQTYRRRTSFFASVNDANFLQDKTGNSRFLVLPVISINYNQVDMLQLYAELLLHAKVEQAKRIKENNQIPEYELTATETEMQNLINSSYSSISPIEELIDKYFDFEQDFSAWNKHMLAIDVLKTIDYPNKTKRETNEIAQILKNRRVKKGNKKINGFYLPPLISLGF